MTIGKYKSTKYNCKFYNEDFLGCASGLYSSENVTYIK